MWNFPIAPEQASEHAKHSDVLFWTITGLTVFFTALVLGLILVFAVLYRAGRKVNRSNPVDTHLGVELLWTGIPTVLALVIFVWSAWQFINLQKPPKEATELFVIGKQWMWHIQHPNGVRENNEVHLPMGRPVKFTMISQDVLHSFYIPEFRLQWHVVPGRYTQMWATPTKPGKYLLLCAMHCGTQHSEMGGYVYVMTEQDYQAWLANQGDRSKPPRPSMEVAGKQLYEQLNCGSCHNAQSNERGPSLYSIYGTKRQLADGRSVMADEAHLREAIVKPYEKLTAGYSNTMPAYADLTEEQVLQLIAYIKTLGFTQLSPSQPSAPAPRNPGPNQAPGATNRAVPISFSSNSTPRTQGVSPR